MNTTPDMTKLRATLAEVIQQYDEAISVLHLRNAEFHEAASKGEDAKADKLQIEIEKSRRLIERLSLRRDALEQDIGSVEAVEQAARAAKLKQVADNILARAGKRIADMEPLASQLAKLVDGLESDFNDWKEARYFCIQSGAAPEGFSTQENDARIGRIVELLGRSKTRAANLASELSRVSVFM